MRDLVVDPIAIIGLVIVLTELVKEAAARLRLRPETVKQVVIPLAVLLMSAALNALNAYLFAGPAPGQPPEGAVRDAVVQGLQLGAMASGIYGLGKAALGRS
ncbi:MAG: hypothetical protein GX496_04740 [Firmicutes bacterium]|uniref:Holin n=1 Tax=Geochorda subterranea TaxID=3109564 RepID=A0ABZ1BNR3_9FIRM|nr:hypothetical protein [Limnochorda sp. LNt]NLG68866.1 hypothetical protein [Bacillota bacterium]WRP14324.1 hypothetical protein VLY81_13025 [Limnochorda sp. LNt]